MVNCSAYADGRKVASPSVDEISEVLRLPDQFVWIGLREPTEELLRKVQAEFGLHDLAVEDALRAHQRPKLEEYGESIFLVLRTAQLEGEQIAFGETHIFAGPRYVVTVRHGPSMSYAEVRARCESTPALLRRGPGAVLYALMDFIVDHYLPVSEALEERLTDLEEEIFSDALSRQTTEHVYAIKRDIAGFRRIVSPLIEVCHRLMRADMSLIPEDTRVYFRDVYDHVLRVNEASDHQRELLSSALEANLSLISVAQNEVMKKLAGWAAILAVPTLLAGIYGMNFEFMPELHWHYGYFAIIGGMFALCGFLYSRFRRAGWL